MGISGKDGPSRAWFILPSVLLLAGLVLGGIGVSSFVNFVRSDFRAYQPDSSISVTNDGFTLYAEDGSLGADDLRDVRCSATGPGGPTKVTTVRFVSAPGSTSRRRTPSTDSISLSLIHI